MTYEQVMALYRKNVDGNMKDIAKNWQVHMRMHGFKVKVSVVEVAYSDSYSGGTESRYIFIDGVPAFMCDHRNMDLGWQKTPWFGMLMTRGVEEFK